MFVGHYAAAMAAKSAEPRAPLWSYFTAAQLLDIGWGAFVIVGIEKMRVDPKLPGSVFDLYYMPWTHSPIAALVWSLAGALLFRYVLRLPLRATLFLGLVVFSHWILDLVVHRPDLQLWPTGLKVGFGLWNAPVLEEAIEMGLLGICAVIWGRGHLRSERVTWSAPALVGVLALFQIAVIAFPPHGGKLAVGITVLGVYLALALAAYAVERENSGRSAGARKQVGQSRPASASKVIATESKAEWSF